MVTYDAAMSLLVIVAALVVLVSIGVGIYALVDVLGHTKDEFLLIGQDRTVWLVAIIGMTLACGVFGLIPAIYYLVVIRPKVLGAP